MIEQLAPGLPNARWVAFRLLDGDHKVREALLSGELAGIEAVQESPAEEFSPIMSIQGSQ